MDIDSEDYADDDSSYAYIGSDDDSGSEELNENLHRKWVMPCSRKRKTSEYHSDLREFTDEMLIADDSVCPLCKGEAHAPVIDCQDALNWVRGIHGEFCSVVTVPSDFVSRAMHHRIQFLATTLDSPPSVISLFVRLGNWMVDSVRTLQRNFFTFRRNHLNHKLDIDPEYRHFLEETALEADEEFAREGEEWGAQLRPAAATGGAVAETVQPAEQADSLVAPRNEPIVCEICFEEEMQDNAFYQMDCGHPFCRTCWRRYLEERMEGNVIGTAIESKCPNFQCNHPVTEELVHQVAPDLIPRFEEHILNSFVRKNSASLCWCPGPECRRIAVKPPQDLLVGVWTCVCKDGCQTHFCFRCGDAPHEGECQMFGQTPPVVATAPRPGKLEEPMALRKCPSCSSPIEKNGGCNHMTCKCGHHFCWLCMADINDAPYKHFCGREEGERRIVRNRNGAADDNLVDNGPIDLVSICSIFDDSDSLTPNESREKHQLDQQLEASKQFAHYFNRFLAHNQGQYFAETQCACIVERKDNFCKISDFKAASATDFFEAANRKLVSCRRVLKWSYCYVYHKITSSSNMDVEPRIDNESIDDEHHLTLFQDYQEQLERFTEQLSELSERALTYEDRLKVLDLIDIVDKYIEPIVGFERRESRLN